MKFKSSQDSEKRKVLLSRVVMLKMRLENTGEHIIYKSSLIKILADLEQELSGRVSDNKKLNQAAFGIFRLVTDSSELENSPLGKELLTLNDQIDSLTQN